MLEKMEYAPQARKILDEKAVKTQCHRKKENGFNCTDCFAIDPHHLPGQKPHVIQFLTMNILPCLSSVPLLSI